MERSFAFFMMVSVLAILVFLLVSVEGRTGGGCQCHYIGKCEYDAQNVSYRYYFCGNCNAYSGWRLYDNCENVRIPLESVP